jgi:hypothetical protein
MARAKYSRKCPSALPSRTALHWARCSRFAPLHIFESCAKRWSGVTIDFAAGMAKHVFAGSLYVGQNAAPRAAISPCS